MNITIIQKLKKYAVSTLIFKSIFLTSIIYILLYSPTLAQIIDTSSIRHLPLETYTHTPENLNKKSGEWLLIYNYSFIKDDHYLDWNKINIEFRENYKISTTKGWVIIKDTSNNFWLQQEVPTQNNRAITIDMSKTLWKNITANTYSSGKELEIKNIIMHLVFESARLPNTANLSLYATKDIAMGKKLLLSSPTKTKLQTATIAGPKFSDLIIDQKQEHSEWESGDYVSDTPQIQVSINDTTSTISTYSIQIKEGSNTIEAVTQNISGSTNSYDLDWTPSNRLSPGNYTVNLIAQNLLNQTSSRQFSIKVSTDIKILGLIAGPIPYNYLNGHLTIEYQLSQNANVDIRIYSIAGEKIKTWNFDSGSQGALQGFNKLTWNGKTTNNTYISNGPYVIYMTASNNSETATSKSKIVVLR